jgi:hypothetical protein
MLMIALMAVAVLTIQGSVALSTALSNITTSTKIHAVSDGQELVEAGIAEMRSRLKGVSFLNNMIADPFALLLLPNATWSAYLLSVPSWNLNKDPEYASNYTKLYTNYIPTVTSLTATTIQTNSLQTTLQYWAKARHKLEYDAELEGHAATSRHYTDNDGSTAVHTMASPGRIIWYGYNGGAIGGLPIEFTASGSPGWVGLNPTGLYPVELVKAYGTSGSTTKTSQAYLAHQLPVVAGALYVKGNIAFPNGGTTNFSGTDNCGVSPAAAAVPPLYTMGTTVSGGWNPGAGAVTNGSTNVDIAGTIARLKANSSAVTTLTADPAGANTYGSALSYVTVYSNTSGNVGGLDFKTDGGYGLLLVDGDLTLDDDAWWNGLIYVSGTLTFKASGVGNIARFRGAIYATNIVILQNAMDVLYDVCHIAKAMAKQPLKILRWRAIS